MLTWSQSILLKNVWDLISVNPVWTWQPSLSFGSWGENMPHEYENETKLRSEIDDSGQMTFIISLLTVIILYSCIILELVRWMSATLL